MRIFEDFFDEVDIETNTLNIDLISIDDIDGDNVVYINMIYHYIDYVRFDKYDYNFLNPIINKIKNCIQYMFYNTFDDISQIKTIYTTLKHEYTELSDVKDHLCSIMFQFAITGRNKLPKIFKLYKTLFNKSFSSKLMLFYINITKNKEQIRIPYFGIDLPTIEEWETVDDIDDSYKTKMVELLSYGSLNEDFFDDTNLDDNLSDDVDDNGDYDLDMIIIWTLAPIFRCLDSLNDTTLMAFKFASTLNYLNEYTFNDVSPVEISHSEYIDEYYEPLTVKDVIDMSTKYIKFIFKFKSRLLKYREYLRYINNLHKLPNICCKKGFMSLVFYISTGELDTQRTVSQSFGDYDDMISNEHKFSFYSSLADIMVETDSIMDFIHKTTPTNNIFRYAYRNCNRVEAITLNMKDFDLSSGDFKIQIFPMALGSYCPYIEYDANKTTKCINGKTSNSDVDINDLILTVENYNGPVHIFKEVTEYGDVKYICVLANEIKLYQTNDKMTGIPMHYHIAVTFRFEDNGKDVLAKYIDKNDADKFQRLIKL